METLNIEIHQNKTEISQLKGLKSKNTALAYQIDQLTKSNLEISSLSKEMISNSLNMNNLTVNRFNIFVKLKNRIWIPLVCCQTFSNNGFMQEEGEISSELDQVNTLLKENIQK